MEFVGSEDIEAPLDQVFEKLCDFEAIERQMLRRGVQVERRAMSPVLEPGMAWDVEFSFRGKSRKADVTLSQIDAPDVLAFTSTTQGLDVTTHIDCVPLSRSQTRVSVKVLLVPRSLPARLMVQSMKLARVKLNKRFSKRLREFAQDFEAKLRAA